jgi:hypothetical protein
MAPISRFIDQLTKRQSFAIKTPNPLQDKTFIATVVGLVVGAVVFLLIVVLLLCLYRENSPLKRCCGRRFRQKTSTPPPPHLKQFHFETPTPDGSETNLVVGAQSMGMDMRQMDNAFVPKGRFYTGNTVR